MWQSLLSFACDSWPGLGGEPSVTVWLHEGLCVCLCLPFFKYKNKLYAPINSCHRCRTSPFPNIRSSLQRAELGRAGERRSTPHQFRSTQQAGGHTRVEQTTSQLATGPRPYRFLGSNVHKTERQADLTGRWTGWLRASPPLQHHLFLSFHFPSSLHHKPTHRNTQKHIAEVSQTQTWH